MKTLEQLFDDIRELKCEIVINYVYCGYGRYEWHVKLNTYPHAVLTTIAHATRKHLANAIEVAIGRIKNPSYNPDEAEGVDAT